MVAPSHELRITTPGGRSRQATLVSSEIARSPNSAAIGIGERIT